MSYKQLFKNFGKAIGTWSISISESAEGDIAYLNIEHSRNMEKAQPVRNTVKVVGKNAGRANATTPIEQARKEMASRIKKQLDKGYVETVEEAKAPVTNALGLQPPMLAARWDLRKNLVTLEELQHAVIQPKLNGNRTLMQNGKAWTRTGQLHKNLGHILKEIEEAGLSDLGLDGEIYIHGVRLQVINSLIKHMQPGTLNLEFHVYDVFGLGDADYAERIQVLAEKFKETPHLKLVHTRPILEDISHERSIYEERVNTLHDEFVGNGYEGAVVRLMGWRYKGGRSNALIKVKNYLDDEYEIIGVERRSPHYLSLSNPDVWMHGVVGMNAYTEQGEASGNLKDFLSPEVSIEGDKLVLDRGVWVCVTKEGKQFCCTIQGDRWEQARLLHAAEEGNYLGALLTVSYFELSEDNIPQQPIALQFREND